MSKMGDSEIAKQWFQLMAEEALLEKKQKLNERKWLIEKQEAREAKALKKSTPPATIECSSYIGSISGVKFRSRGRSRIVRNKFSIKGI
jgi:hypothetical protein